MKARVAHLHDGKHTVSKTELSTWDKNIKPSMTRKSGTGGDKDMLQQDPRKSKRRSVSADTVTVSDDEPAQIPTATPTANPTTTTTSTSTATGSSTIAGAFSTFSQASSTRAADTMRQVRARQAADRQEARQAADRMEWSTFNLFMHLFLDQLQSKHALTGGSQGVMSPVRADAGARGQFRGPAHSCAMLEPHSRSSGDLAELSRLGHQRGSGFPARPPRTGAKPASLHGLAELHPGPGCSAVQCRFVPSALERRQQQRHGRRGLRSERGANQGHSWQH